MSLQHMAQHLAARGRNGDSTLVHMTPGEVHGLQALALAHGGSLTANPDTGLPEANFLKSILPMLAGAVLTGGMGIPAIAAAGLVGGGTALASKDLGKGLMAGLGAFGGAGLASGLAGLGATTAADATAQTLAASGTASTADAINAANTAANTALTGGAGGAGGMMGGLKAAVQNPQGFISAMGGGKAAMRAGMQAGLPFLTNGMTPQQPEAQTTTPHPMISPASYEYGPTQSRFAEGGETAKPGTGVYNGYPLTGASSDAYAYLMGQRASSPQADAARAMPAYPAKVTGAKYEGLPQYTFDTQTGMFSLATPPAPAPSAEQVAQQAGRGGDGYYGYDYGNAGDGGGIGGGAGGNARGGLMGLAEGGRLLDGPGDGVSDSIPAKIDGKRPARLATGEFVFDARTVSEIGNGDTKAGAKKLYAVMNAIHRKRATAERGKPSGADQSLRHLLT